MFGNPETTPGGRALKFYATVRLEVRRSEQLKQGDEYKKLNGAISINILNFNLLNNNRYHNHFLFKENQTNEVFTDLMQIHIIELAKFNKDPKDIQDDLESWVEFLKEPSVEVVEMLSKKVPEIIEAFEVLKVVSSDVETRRDAEICSRRAGWSLCDPLSEGNGMYRYGRA